MGETLTVHINRGGPHAVESQSTFETDGSFSLVLDNHGPPAHVYLRPRGNLVDTTRIGTPNQYVEDRETVTVEAVEDRPEEVTGRLEVVTGYGAESTSIAVTLTTPDHVVVDESLSSLEPADREDRWGDPRTAAVGGLAALAVLLAGAVVATGGDTAAVVLGAVAVLAAVGTALYARQSA